MERTELNSKTEENKQPSKGEIEIGRGLEAECQKHVISRTS